MILFPAIDILNGRAVRLLYGKKELVTDYGTPIDRAKQWLDCGAEWLHVVNLNGAFDGKSGIEKEIYEIAKLGIPVETGGGIRTREDVKNRFESGATRVIIGTMYYTDPELFYSLVEEYKEKIVAGIDGKDGYLAIKGWTEISSVKVTDFGKKAKASGVDTCVFTDIAKDGAMQGVSLEQTVELYNETGLNVIASGGISSSDDLIKLKENGVYGAILGRSIYTGAIDLRRAIEEMK